MGACRLRNTKCGLNVESANTFLELRVEQKVLSWGRAVDAPIVIVGYALKADLIVSNLLHGINVMLGMTWLQEVDPLILWSVGIVYIPNSI